MASNCAPSRAAYRQTIQPRPVWAVQRDATGTTMFRGLKVACQTESSSAIRSNLVFSIGFESLLGFLIDPSEHDAAPLGNDPLACIWEGERNVF